MRRALTVLATTTLLLVPSVVTATPKPAADAPNTGAHIATTVCAECHAVSADTSKQSPDPQAPRFVDVAMMPSTTELSIKVFLRSSHRNMPNLMLNDEEVGSLAAYILGLHKK